jgi:hypothetical protein
MADGPATARVRAWVAENPTPWSRRQRMQLDALINASVLETRGPLAAKAMAFVQLSQWVTGPLQTRALLDSPRAAERSPLLWMSVNRRAHESLEALDAGSTAPELSQYERQVERSREIALALEHEAGERLVEIGEEQLRSALTRDEAPGAGQSRNESAGPRGNCHAAQAAQSRSGPVIGVVRLQLEQLRRLSPALPAAEITHLVKAWIKDLEEVEAALDASE